ncbi:uncharacterized protein LOC116130101 [Pistacia vera]|uniref:uncharacterized protein LOC116130101 n=1 Tax=Pistacia vera TaxID=55513 RepID=UPI001263D514|nr:uncharacterized protein LOC116130101 [Pistacia vera]
MAQGDEMMEGSISSLIVESLQSNQSGDVLSPEDLAWVDSCLIKDAEVSDSSWNALKDALLEIVSSEPVSISYSAAGSGGSPRETDIMIHTPSKEAETAKFPVTNDNDGVVPILVDSETNSDSYPIKQNNGISLSPVFQGDDATETFVGDPFLPSYKEGREIYKDGKRESETIGSGLDLDPSAVELEPLSEDIFKVWDLGVSAEEEELFTQLNKALSENTFQSTSSAFDDSGSWKDLKDDSLDNLIAGIADLSLN